MIVPAGAYPSTGGGKFKVAGSVDDDGCSGGLKDLVSRRATTGAWS